MKLTDPFGRMERRHQLGYERMRKALREAGIETPDEAKDVISQAWKRGFKIMGVGMLLLLGVLAIIPIAAPLILVVAIIMVGWVVSSNINGQKYINRYIEKEMKP
ncbi:MAG: hypothetical protein N0C81_19925 [Candidatus Thiodiazotropha lotti]|uniref:Uncharacterized protein n=1 Tax=Candidatus Thiodiazotropha lotti TaxID=2792787 RepID=A0A9E4K6T9_9GAMM|nr:hypothetical protein [Candidatus Thiodiazotropha lotti]ODB99732.1 hypothetical protein A3197_12510 [Candidatus Thiodiazotropha endoloripes]MCG7921496.1 hypothetical protein [Candidatus Thiodiazotropha lotti]MCG7932410.1 hypothetical protein [Candidatus Thiodiazotropha lotti]MCG7939509.1 hypothetical protein [Candidatus Thiodiazotropha lotti]